MRSHGNNGNRRVASVLAVLAMCLGGPLFAGFSSTETYLPAVGRIPGKSGAQFYTTIWATNLTGSTVHFTFDFLAQNQANPSPASFADTLSPGETKVYENVVETKLGLNDALGAARVVSDGEILVSERIYNQEPGDDLGKTEGLFFAGVPKGFSVALGESASIQGINQGGAENFRYNFALVETGGSSATVHVVLYDGDGHSLGSKDYILQAYEQIQPNVDDLKANLATTNARITATVTAGAGSVLLAGAQLANESQDSSGFEMSFRDDLLGGGGGGGVTSLNGLTGAVTIAHGANTTVNVNGQTITIDAVSGSGTGLTAVAHDNSLSGSGTVSKPLAIASGQVVRSVNGLHDAVALAAGSGVTIAPSGQTLTIAAPAAGSLTLPYTGALDTADPLITLDNNLGTGLEVEVSANGVNAVNAVSTNGTGVLGGTFTSGSAGVAGVGNFSGGDGVEGVSEKGHGVHGRSSATGVNASAIYAESTGTGGIGLFATNNGTDAAIVATNASSSGYVFKGFGSGGSVQAFFVTSAGDVQAHGSFFAGSIDYADRLPAEADLEPGDVVAIGSDGLLHRTMHATDAAVAGVYSTRPGVEGHEDSETRLTVPVALAGVIPVKVTAENGPIRPGDLLVSSSMPGRAMRAPTMPAPGTVLGKAMEPLRSDNGTIRMLVMLR